MQVGALKASLTLRSADDLLLQRREEQVVDEDSSMLVGTAQPSKESLEIVLSSLPSKTVKDA